MSIAFADQQMPDVFITIETESQLQQRELKPLLKNIACKHVPTIESTLHAHYGLRAYYCVSHSASAHAPYNACSFDIYVSRFVNIKALITHLKEHGFYQDSREICFIDGTYDEEEDNEETS
jgi:hypothetical protein